MTLIALTGFESGDLNEHTIDAYGSYQPTLSVSTVSPRTGSYCLEVNKNWGSAGDSGKAIRIDIPSTQEIYVGFGLNLLALPDSTLHWVFKAECPTTRHVCMAFGAWGGPNGQLGIRRYLSYSPELGSVYNYVTLNEWHRVGIYLKIADSGGRAQWFLDGIERANFTGDVRNAGTEEITKIFFGGGVDGTVSTRYRALFDDIVICTPTGSMNNDIPGNIKIYGLTSSGAGHYSQLTPSAGANYECVNEIPASDADYVSSAIVGQKDTYTLADLPVSTGAIKAVKWQARAQMSNADAGNIARLLRLKDNDYQGSDVVLGSSWAYFKEILETNPLTADQWAIGALNALEDGEVVR
jgi:hypothetical protein